MNVAIAQPQTTPPVEDEKAAIMSLLGLQTSKLAGEISNLGMTLAQIGKKRKYHTSVDGQFDDAEDSPLLPKLPFTGIGFQQLQSHLQRDLSSPSAKESKQAAIPIPPDVRNETSNETSFPPPHPPHLIKQTSNEYAVAATTLSEQASAELARQAAVLAFQRQTMLAAEAGRFPPHFATMMGGGAVAAAVVHESDAALLERERRLQMEAILNFQAQVKLGVQSRPHSGLAAALGGPPDLTALRASLDANNTPASQHVGPNSTIKVEATVAGKEEVALNALTARSANTASVTMNRVVDSEEDEDNSSEASDTRIKDRPRGLKDESQSSRGKKGSRSKAARAFSTKIRYEQYTPPSSWAELTSVSRMPPTKSDEKHEHPIEIVGHHDVLLGRGGLTNTNPGNIRFRALVSKYRVHYCTAPKGEKGALARYLCNFVRANDGRFLQKDPSDQKWYEVGDEKAVMKCGQALREGTAWLIRKALDPSECDGSQPAK